MQGASVVVVPGLGGSSPGHWQSIWQAQHPAWVRSTPASWDEPDSDDWDRAVGTAVQEAGEPVVLVAHDVGDAGHINVLSGHGPWPEGLDLLRGFIRDLEGGR